MKNIKQFLWLGIALYLFFCTFSCGSAQKEIEPKATSSFFATVSPFQEGIELLARRLVTSSRKYRIGKLAVADFVGPGDEITPLGEHISDKLSVGLFSSGAFPEFMERKQLKQILLSHKDELSDYFDQRTVSNFGKIIGTESIVIGSIEDLGTVYDVTAKIVESSTGRLQGMADVRLIKDATTAGLLANAHTASLTISVEPAVDGTVVAGDQRGKLENGVLSLTGIPYGECQVVIQATGYKPIRRSINIRSRSETLGVRLPMRHYEVSFQIIPPDASLVVDGQAVSLNSQGFSKMKGLQDLEYSYVVKAKGYRDRLGTFNPSLQSVIELNLPSSDPFFSTKSRIFQTVQQVKKNQKFEITLWTNHTTYRLGDTIYFYFRAEKDCYINLIDINSDGEIRLLFPNRFHPDNYVRGGVIHQIPGDDYGFTFEAEPPTGPDRIFVTASSQPLGVFSHDFSQDAFLALTRGNTRGATVRGIGVRLDRAELSAAAECVVHIRK